MRAKKDWGTPPRLEWDHELDLQTEKKNEEGLQGLRDTVKRNNLPITGVQEKRGRKKQKA